MVASTEEILDLLRAGEDGRAEFKKVRLGDRGVLSPDIEALAGERVAFANAPGGGVFLEIADSGAVAGIAPSRVDAVERWIVNVATLRTASEGAVNVHVTSPRRERAGLDTPPPRAG